LPVTGQQNLPYPTQGDHTVVSLCPLYEAVQANDTKLSEQLGSVHGWNIKHILHCYNIPFKILYRLYCSNFIPEIFSSQGSEYNDFIQSPDVVEFCRYSSSLWRNLVPPSQRRTILYLLPLSPEIEAAGTPKCRYLST